MDQSTATDRSEPNEKTTHSPDSARYAIYYAPEEGSPLNQFGQRWLGRDFRTGAPLERPMIEGIFPEELNQITASAAFYGFHGTLKPPFFLASPHLPLGLISAIKRFAANERSFLLPKLRLARMGRFLALTPLSPSPGIDGLAARCVRAFDSFRRRPSQEELKRRRSADLSTRQEEHLQKWGYPYVLDQFRFHLTLTGPIIDPTLSDYLIQVINAQLAHLELDRIEVSSVCLFVQASVHHPFRLHSRYRFKAASNLILPES